jgi:cyanophycinase
MTAKGWHQSSLLLVLMLLPVTAFAIEEDVRLDLTPPLPGSLVICGGGDIPDSVMLRFIELAGGPAARIVFIPTAAEGADSDEADEDLLFFRQQDLASLSVLHTRDRQVANNPDFVSPLNQATGVWLAGGCQRLLADVYQGTKVDEALRKLFQRGGTIGGISAGAAVMSPVMIRGGRRNPETGPGFGLLPGTVIDQHFLKRGRQDRLLRVLAANPGLVGIGIDEGAAVIVQGSRLSVMGDSCVVTCLAASADWPEEVQQLSPGEEADLSRLVRLAWIRSQPAKSPNEQHRVTPATALAMAERPAAPAALHAATKPTVAAKASSPRTPTWLAPPAPAYIHVRTPVTYRMAYPSRPANSPSRLYMR